MSSPERVAAGDGQHWSENGIKFLGRRSSAATSDTSYWTKNWGLVRQWLFIIKQIKWFENISIVVRSQMLFKGKKEILFRNQDKTFASFTFVSICQQYYWTTKNNLCTFDFLRKVIFALLYMWAISESIIYSFQDIPIAIPAPLNTIPDQILPSHIVVPRCSGK